jgi:predicted nucleic acid-binding protein
MTTELIYWDSCAFLGWLQEETDKVDLCRGTLERAKAGEVGIVTSALTLTEVLWTKGAPKLERDKALTLRRFFRHSYIRVYNVTHTVAEVAQDVVWSHKIKPKDAIHVATAIELKVPYLETFDIGLLKKSGLVGTPPLQIRHPIAPLQGSLDLGG